MGTKVIIALLGAVVLATCGGCGRSNAEQASDHTEAAAASSDKTVSKDAADKAGPADKGDADAKGAGDSRNADDDAHPHPLELTAEQVAKLGVVTTAVQEAHYAGAAEGFGVVISHELVAQAAADLQAATAASRLSDTALARAKRLAEGPGALGIDTVENAQRQQAADQSALLLARRKLTALLGVGFPWHGDAAGGELAKLADGSNQLLRVTFPPSSAAASVPKVLRVASLDAPGDTAWTAHTVWAAPQDPTLPGRSVFAVLTNAGLAEGARVRAQTSSDSGAPGVVVPDAAIIITNGEYWCYVKKKEGVYQRVAIDSSRPSGEGYFVAEGISAGEEVVTTGAGLMLARELNSSTEAED
jgi:hypothetical protein